MNSKQQAHSQRSNLRLKQTSTLAAAVECAPSVSMESMAPVSVMADDSANAVEQNLPAAVTVNCASSIPMESMASGSVTANDSATPVLPGLPPALEAIFDGDPIDPMQAMTAVNNANLRPAQQMEENISMMEAVFDDDANTSSAQIQAPKPKPKPVLSHLPLHPRHNVFLPGRVGNISQERRSLSVTGMDRHRDSAAGSVMDDERPAVAELMRRRYGIAEPTRPDVVAAVPVSSSDRHDLGSPFRPSSPSKMSSPRRMTSSPSPYQHLLQDKVVRSPPRRPHPFLGRSASYASSSQGT